MRRLVLWFVGAFVLCFAVHSALAQGQGRNQGQTRQRKADEVAKQDPNRTPAGSRSDEAQSRNRLAEQQNDPNAQAIVTEQQEQPRQQIREQIRRRAEERSRTSSGTGKAGHGPSADVNAPPAAEGKMKDRGRNMPVEETIAKGTQHQQQLTAIDQQMSHEEAKYRDRLARLKRIRELAQQQGNTETLARVDKLLEQEQQHYGAKTLRMTHRKDRIAEFSRKTTPGSPAPAKGRRGSAEVLTKSDKSKKAAGEDVNTDSNQPAAENE